MKNKLLRNGLVAVACGLLAAVVWAQANGGQLLAAFAKTLQDAPSLSTTYTFQPVGGAPATYSVELAKPNLARIDGPKTLVIADGKQIATLDKEAKTWFRDPQTPEALLALFNDPALSVWRPFFDAKAMTNVPGRATGTRNRRGMSLTAVQATLPGPVTATFYLSSGDNLVRQAEFVSATPSGEQRDLLDTRTLELGKAAKEGSFAFKAPEGFRELTAEERNAVWFEDLSKAMAEAKRSKRVLMIDFAADW